MGRPAEQHQRSGARLRADSDGRLEERTIRVLAVSGSLRRVSSNTALVQAAAHLAPDGVEVRVYSQLAELPLFNPDLDGDRPPAVVVQWRSELEACTALLISSPEYAHGVPGALKNALDWIVGSGELAGKPVALVNTSPRSTHAQASLAETLRVMSANLIDEASIAVPLGGRHLNAAGIVADAELSRLIRLALAALANAAGPHGASPAA